MSKGGRPPAGPSLTFRETSIVDLAALESLYTNAFLDEDLVPLVRELLSQSPTSVLSLAALREGEVVAHVAFTRCAEVPDARSTALLAPLAVMPDRQRQGVGSALVRSGLERVREAGTDLIFVLGDPAYYGRFGFRQEDTIRPPYPIPAEWRSSWQSMSLSGALTTVPCSLVVPPVWARHELWST